ncbi:glycosyltransferase, partial [Pantanalinema sp. GBBB05]|uniref:glycosyltransferase n=1 Tax=Pantanalinema sp. GBBB05 TaxID=2604139 RepID=UPI001DA14697|nr:UDP-N-acetylglucosamine--N-acetylmuramyl-(pentapeptide) pyrophosphoryl-undecaprenol N-acetylglucosamine transferase [Pantanalinema sp. GBBB05]
TLYCADREIYQTLKTIPSPQTELTLVADPVDNSTDIIQADLVIGRAGRNLLSELIALGKRGIVVPVSAEKFRAGNQLQTAEMAVKLNPNLHLALVQDGYDAFRDTLRHAIAANYQPIHWQPGNDTALVVIQEFLSEGRGS